MGHIIKLYFMTVIKRYMKDELREQ